MTEEEWLTCADVHPMLDTVRDKARGRKGRLFGCACVRRITLHMPDIDVSEELGAAERYAEGLCGIDKLHDLNAQLGARGGFSAAWAANNALHGLLDSSDYIAATHASNYVAQIRFFMIQDGQGAGGDDVKDIANAAYQAEAKVQCGLLRDVFGNPFRPTDLDRSWLTSDVLALGRGIYEERAFDRMPILADALQDGGCTNEDILNHLRDPNATHVRGCWALDLVLGKS